jgi:hypothetical protein
MASQAFARIGIFVNKDLYPEVQDSVQQYIAELHMRGHQTWLNTSYDATHSINSLRNYLKTLYIYYDLEGAIFIGDLPIAEYEVEDDFNKYGYRTFPIDLYYMDLDGTWLDEALDGDWGGHAQTGIFDGHADGYGDREVEIWISRITASAVPGLGSEEEVVQDYFDRLKIWMDGDDTIDHHLLIFGNDEEWPSTEAWGGAGLLGFGLGETETYFRSDEDDTEINWMEALRAGQKYALITEHSSPTYHAMLYGFSNKEYLNMSLTGDVSNTRFYNLFACSNSRYTVPNFLGGLYALGHSGLVSIGSTKTGAMLDFDTYNTRLGLGDTYGEAFKHWLNAYVLAGSVPDRKISWHYGMTLAGVGALTLNYEPECFSNVPDPVLTVEGRENYTIGANTFTRYKLDVTNSDLIPDALFAASPHLPACGLNNNASRTWVDIYDNNDNKIYGFCGFSSSDNLDDLWFAVPKGTQPPESVYIVMNDRECGVTYTSNLAKIASASASITSLWQVYNAQCGQNSRLWARVENTGGAALPSDARVWFYVSGPGFKGYVGSTSAAGLYAGGSRWYFTDWSIPSAAQAGTYNYWAMVWSPSSDPKNIAPWSSAKTFTVTCQ